VRSEKLSMVLRNSSLRCFRTLARRAVGLVDHVELCDEVDHEDPFLVAAVGDWDDWRDSALRLPRPEPLHR
jgi:hypothetical protein